MGRFLDRWSNTDDKKDCAFIMLYLFDSQRLPTWQIKDVLKFTIGVPFTSCFL